MGTPATNTCWGDAGSTQIRPNHQPNVDWELDRNDVFVIRVHVSPPLVDVQKPTKSPEVSAAMAYSRLGVLLAPANPMRPRFVPAAGRPPARRVQVVPP